MKNKIVVFLLFFALMYIIFLRLDFVYNSPLKGDKPNFVLYGAKIEHFVQGNLEFKVNSDKIEIFDKVFVMYDSVISIENGAVISANVINYFIDTYIIHASSNVYFKFGNHVYTGNELEYDMKNLLLNTYRGGEFNLND